MNAVTYRIKLFFVFFLAFSTLGNGQFELNTRFRTPFEVSKGKRTATYEEIIDHYKKLADTYSQAKLVNLGRTDAGDPLNLFVVSPDRIFDPIHPSRKNKTVIMIMNGIHSGEPDGIDASMMFFDVILNSQNEMKEFSDVIFVVFPVYNVGGCKNQKPNRRANQNGPELLGSRGNSKNLDLNRDFIKADSRNAKLFQKTFGQWKPDIFLDTHVSNGADYPYTNTLLSTTADKLYGPQKVLLKESLEPHLFQKMRKAGFEMCPYVNVFGADPKNGITQFFDSPRYSTGYASLHHCIGFMLENHMLKDFKDRVNSTFEFLVAFGAMGMKYSKEIREAKQKAEGIALGSSVFPILWDLDESQKGKLKFKGYTRKRKLSMVTGDSVWFFDRENTWVEEIPYLNAFQPIDSVSKPFAYLIPYAWGEIVENLKRNGVRVNRLKEAGVFSGARAYQIDEIETSARRNGGHYFHETVKLSAIESKQEFSPGDFVVFTDQSAIRFIMETLEPRAHDSFFRWNFFDATLQRHEWFSSYVFDEYAEGLLAKEPDFRLEFEKKKKEDLDFASSSFLQYLFIFDHSPFREPEYNLYPIVRLEEKVDVKVN
jgi:Zinc carboxypeptidase